MPDILIRDVPDEVNAELVSQAKRNRRSKEKHALYLIERALSFQPAETCGELLEAIWSAPAPEVKVEDIDAYLATRGRRSNRP